MKIEDAWKDAESGTLTLDEFNSRVAGAKFVDLKEGGYVSKAKHDAELEAKEEQINQLNATLGQRETDLKEVQQKLADAGQDTDKLTKVSDDLTALQTKYADDMKAYEDKLVKQARDFAIKEYAGSKKFTSAAAKRDYIKSMQASEEVKLSKKGVLTGINEFDTEYRTDNEDAFLKEEPNQEVQTQQENKLPVFVGHTSGEPNTDDVKPGSFGFSFIPQPAGNSNN